MRFYLARDPDGKVFAYRSKPNRLSNGEYIPSYDDRKFAQRWADLDFLNKEVVDQLDDQPHLAEVQFTLID